jgi:hypothetical protein
MDDPEATMTGIESPHKSIVNHETDWAGGIPWDRYLEEDVREHVDLWQGVWKRARSPRDQLDRMERIGGSWRLLILSEDWCGDASNLVPVLARFAADAPQLELRVLKRDEHPEVMDLYLTNGTRSIPLAIVLNEDGDAVARWGPRPDDLQEFVLRARRIDERPMSEIYKDIRRWYATDRGYTTIRELVDRIERATL